MEDTEMYEIIGKCPRCGGDVLNYPKSYECSKWKERDGGCKLNIWKNMYNKMISVEEAQRLLGGAVLGPFEFTTKNGDCFRARMCLDGCSIKMLFEPDVELFDAEDMLEDDGELY